MPKLSHDQLREIGVRQWSDIENDFAGSDLYLGNGFSIKISNMLNYGRLFDKFLEHRTEAQRVIFEEFGTTNFEFILERLNNAITVNEIFNQPNPQIAESVEELRSGLIEAINENHPRFHDLNDQIFINLSVAFDTFNDIYTTNYDTFLYRIIMNTIDRHRTDNAIVRYQDYFWNRVNDWLQFMDTQDEGDYKNVYFLHGALFIHQTNTGHFKIRRGNQNTELIDIISDRITTQQFPLFVAEGTSQEKENKIGKSGYLSFCRTKFRNTRRNMVIYGSSLSAQDTHFISDLNHYRRNLAISIWCGEKSAEQLNAERVATIAKFNHLIDETVVVFDSDGLFT